MRAHEVFCTKFNAQQLSFEAFSNIPNRYSVILAVFSPKVNVLSHYSKQFFSNQFEIDFTQYYEYSRVSSVI